MKLLRNVFIVVFLVSGILLARTDKDVRKTSDRDKNQYYLIKGHAEDNKGQLDRKRSHKRRRKMKKPVKGLR